METNLSSYLKDARRAAGVKQGEIANHLGYSTPQFISNWERGVSAPPVEAIKKLSTLLKVDPNHLFNLVCDADAQKTKEKLTKIYNASV